MTGPSHFGHQTRSCASALSALSLQLQHDRFAMFEAARPSSHLHSVQSLLQGQPFPPLHRRLVNQRPDPARTQSSTLSGQLLLTKHTENTRKTGMQIQIQISDRCKAQNNGRLRLTPRRPAWLCSQGSGRSPGCPRRCAPSTARPCTPRSSSAHSLKPSRSPVSKHIERNSKANTGTGKNKQGGGLRAEGSPSLANCAPGLSS